MGRRHGWSGSPPADDDEARRRIIEAAMRVVDERGPAQFSLSQVAAELGVIRQTVYRYFDSTASIFAAVGEYAIEEYINDLAEHLRPLTDPADWYIEMLATTIEWIPERKYLMLLLASGRSEEAEIFTKGITSPGAMAIGRDIFKRASIDWPAAGYDDPAVDGLIELMLRLSQSMLIDPPANARSSTELRAWLRRWLAPGLT